MRAKKFSVARVVLETTSALGIGTGRGDDVQDSLFVTDANGLPAIPGTSLAGVLRHSFEVQQGVEKRTQDKIFGYQERDEGWPSAVRLSWGHVHGPDDKPVPFLRLDPVPEAHQRFFALLQSGVVRDHVRLNGQGAVDGNGKFDETLVPLGARFTVELFVEQILGRVDDPEAVLRDLIGRLASPALRLGGRTRRGHGAFVVRRVQFRTFDLSKADDRSLFAKLPRDISTPVPNGVLESITVPSAANLADLLGGTLELNPEDLWLFGGGEVARASHRRGDRDMDMIPKWEPSIQWSGSVGSFKPVANADYLVPASSIKGAIRHRTAFHMRRLLKQWIDTEASGPKESTSNNEELDALVRDLFGSSKAAGQPDIATTETSGTPGRVFLADVFVSVDANKATAPKEKRLDHVSIDRFTGGPLDGALFDELALYGGTLTVPITINTRGFNREESRLLRQSFKCALDDLLQGKLAVGAGANRGHGYFQGTLKGDTLRTWLMEP